MRMAMSGTIVSRQDHLRGRWPHEKCRQHVSGNYVGKPPASTIVDAVLIGYARVLTAEQNPVHQVDALRRAGVGEGDIHVDTASGAKASRPQLDLVIRLLRR
jgi:hypothetical protein